MTDSDRDLEARLRAVLHADADAAPIRLTGVELRSKARGQTAPSNSFPLRAAAVMVFLVVIGVLAFGQLPAQQASPTATTGLASSLPSPTAVRTAPATASPTPGVTPSPTATPTASPAHRPAIAPPGGVVLARFRQDGDSMWLDVATVDHDGSFAAVVSITDVATLSAIENPTRLGAIVSPDGFVAVDGTEQSLGAPTTLVFDLYGDGSTPSRTPLVVQAYGRDAVWGPTGELAASTDHSIVIFDPTTGATTTIETGQRYYEIGWLPDGSDVVVIDHQPSGDLCCDDLFPIVIHRDGSRESLPTPVPGVIWSKIATRPYGANAEFLLHATSSSAGGGGPRDGEVTRVFPRGGSLGPIWATDAPLTSGSGQWDATGTGLWFQDDPDQDGGEPVARTASLIHYVGPEESDRTVRFQATSDELGGLMLAPDDLFALIGDGALRWIDMQTGASQLIDPTSIDDFLAWPWQVAGWSTDFPAYPVQAPGPGAGRPPLAPPGTAIVVKDRQVGDVTFFDIGTVDRNGRYTLVATLSDPERLDRLVDLWDRGVAVSNDGFLAIDAEPSGILIYDLYAEASPSVPLLVEGRGGNSESVGMIWGPTNDIAAVHHDGGVVIFDPRTSETVTLGAAGDAPSSWLADGSGVAVVEQPGIDDEFGDPILEALLLDGTREPLRPPYPPALGHLGPLDARPYGADGDHIWYVSSGGVENGDATGVRQWGSGDGAFWGSETSSGGGVWDASGTGLWFVDDPDGVLGRDGPHRRAFLRHFDRPNHVDRSVGFRVAGDLVGGLATLAPDDSFAFVAGLVVDLESGESHPDPFGGRLAGWSADFPAYPLDVP